LNQTTGGWLHIHENLDSGTNQTGNCSCGVKNLCQVEATFNGSLADDKRLIWCSITTRLLETLMGYLPSSWVITLRHIEHIKSYAPRVSHVVFDVECRPI